MVIIANKIGLNDEELAVINASIAAMGRKSAKEDIIRDIKFGIVSAKDGEYMSGLLAGLAEKLAPLNDSEWTELVRFAPYDVPFSEDDDEWAVAPEIAEDGSPIGGVRNPAGAEE